MNNLFRQNLDYWELSGDIAGAVLIGLEAFAAIGTSAWAFFSVVGLGNFANSGAAVIGVGAGLFTAYWIFQSAIKQGKEIDRP